MSALTKPTDSSPKSHRHPPLPIAIAVGLTWLGLMLWLVLSTSNPVTLNREQIQRSTMVVQGSLDDANKAISVKRSWPADKSLEGEVLKLQNLPVIKSSGVDFLIPLTQSGDQFQVTTTRLPEEPPLIYPATPQAIDQLEAILNIAEK